MPALLPLHDAFDSAFEILPFNRRVSIRYSCGLATATAVQVEKRGKFQRVQACNISQGGLSIIMDQSLEQGLDVCVRMKNKILDFTYDLSAQVAHAAVRDDGRWQVGLSFARQLTRSELAGLL